MSGNILAQKQNAEMLANTIIKAGIPHKDSSTRLLKISSVSLGLKTAESEQLLNFLTSKATKSTEPHIQQLHKTCLKHILNSLALCAFRYEWLGLPLGLPHFTTGQYHRELGFDHRRMRRCIDTLVSEGIMISGRKGHQGGKVAPGKVSQFYPSEETIRRFCQSLYSEPESFENLTDDQLYQFNRFEAEHKPSRDSYQFKLEIIRNYNSFMANHSWAMKSPSYRSIKDFDCRSGRIFNFYQNLAERRVRIRSRTLIDGQPLSEPDFSANHLRMASYFFGISNLPKDPYSDVANVSGLTREQIKRVVTECIGAPTLRHKGNLFRRAHLGKITLSAEQYGKALETLVGHYPWLKDVFFRDYGTRLQYLEGEISIEMMHWATQHNIPLIPVHDAYAVRHQDHDITHKVMHEKWQQVMDKARSSYFIANTEFTTDIVIERNNLAKQGRHRH